MPMLAAVSDADQDRIRGLLDLALRGKPAVSSLRPGMGACLPQVYPREGRKRPGGIYHGIKDITERKQAEDSFPAGTHPRRLVERDLRLRCRSLRFVQVNQGAQRNLGYNMDELKRLTPIDLKPEFTRETSRR